MKKTDLLKPMTPSERIRHSLGAFQMFLAAGREEGALKMLSELYTLADELEASG
tara:strand:+ start:4116 stop:4277 length:162 start_codon:yes stop_codon:yes gene_type:complete